MEASLWGTIDETSCTTDDLGFSGVTKEALIECPNLSALSEQKTAYLIPVGTRLGITAGHDA